MGFGGRVVLTVEASQHFVNLLLRDPMLTRYLLSSFVCLSVQSSNTRQYWIKFKTTGPIELVFVTESSFHLYCVLSGYSGVSK